MIAPISQMIWASDRQRTHSSKLTPLVNVRVGFQTLVVSDSRAFALNPCSPKLENQWPIGGALEWPLSLGHTSPKSELSAIFLSDYIRRRCSWLCQGTKKQISNQKVFCEASPNGLPASADCLRGGQHGNVSSGKSKADSHLMYIWAPFSWIPSFTPKCKQSLLFLSLDLL